MNDWMKVRGMMSQQQKIIQLPIVGMFLFGLLALVFLVGRKRSSEPEPSGAVSKHTVGNSSEDALKYWTADKMRKSKPAKMPHVKNPGHKKEQPERPPRTPDPTKSE
jgi:hypothetical protein